MPDLIGLATATLALALTSAPAPPPAPEVVFLDTCDATYVVITNAHPSPVEIRFASADTASPEAFVISSDAEETVQWPASLGTDIELHYRAVIGAPEWTRLADWTWQQPPIAECAQAWASPTPAVAGPLPRPEPWWIWLPVWLPVGAMVIAVLSIPVVLFSLRRQKV
jgi:hypothetical protein